MAWWRGGRGGVAADGRSRLNVGKQWEELLPSVPLGPDAHHLFKIRPTTKAYSHVKLCMIPDGGIVSLVFSFSFRHTAHRHAETPSPY